jgi:hypothetical protein
VSRSTRQAGHTAANAVVMGYLLAAAVRVVVHSPGAAPDWLLVHLLLLGALTNAIVTWSSHFAIALLQQPQLPAAVPIVRLLVLNAAVVGVLVAVSEGSRAGTIGSAALLTLVVLAQLAALVRIGHAGRARRFAPTVRFYWFAAAALLLGVSAGVTMAVGDLPAAWYERVYLTHVHLNLFGWITLTVLGTLFTLWPTALRTRMVTGLERAATACLLCCAGGLALAVAGLLSWTRPLATVGLLLYCAGVLVFLDPFVRTARRRAPHGAATVLLAAGTGWLLAGLGYDVVALCRGPVRAGRGRRRPGAVAAHRLRGPDPRRGPQRAGAGGARRLSERQPAHRRGAEPARPGHGGASERRRAAARAAGLGPLTRRLAARRGCHRAVRGLGRRRRRGPRRGTSGRVIARPAAVGNRSGSQRIPDL